MNKSVYFVLSMTLVAGLFVGCEKSADKAPVLPPEESMSMDFSNFALESKSVTQNEVKGITAGDKSHWALASGVASVWNLILAVNLAVPVASFKATVDQTPVYLDNKKWEWSNNFNVVGATYKSRLTGQIGSDDVKWEMYVSREGAGAFNELLWFEGTSKLDGKSGQWMLNHSQAFPEPMLQIDWKVEGEKVGNIKYTYIREQKDDRTTDLFNSSYIEYGLTANPLNAFYNVHQNTGTASVFNDVFIEWNTTGHNGHIKASHHFQDELWHCWNEIGDNVICN